jgi:hypothetical protein
MSLPPEPFPPAAVKRLSSLVVETLFSPTAKVQ